MNRHKLYSIFFFISLVTGMLAMMMTMTGCSDDDEEVMQAGYGYVQFKVYKSASHDKEKTTRTALDKLETLREAQKVKVLMQYNGFTITQTLLLNSYSEDNAEFGLRSDKLQLMAGRYTVIGFYLYDKLDELLYAGPAGDDNTFTIVEGGLEMHALEADAVERGLVSFKLVKNLVKTRTGETEEFYPFSNIKLINITVKNLFTQELTEFKNVPVSIEDGFNEDDTYTGTDGKEHHPQTTYGECDTIVWLKAGSYQVSSYTTYSDTKGKNVMEVAAVVNTSKTFVVKDNEMTENAEVPVRLSETAEYIKDYIALKAIWEALDGENWKYYGEEETVGVNWNFNKDIDLWGEQPGVGLLTNGRVATLSLAGFSPKGVVPDEIGQLTELEILALGTHSELTGGKLDFAPDMSDEQKRKIRWNYDSQVLARDIREDLSEGLKEAINNDSRQKPIKSRITKKDVGTNTMTNGITGISRAVMRLTKLSQFYIANSPVKDFFVDVREDSEFYDERNDWSWSNFTDLTDLEIYNCPNLTELPMEMLRELPELQQANFSRNPGISGETLKRNWEELIEGASGEKVQMLYFGYNNLEETPDYDHLKRMVKLGLLDCTHNKLKKIHPFGKEVNLTKFYLDYNEIEELPHADDGYFFGYYDVESFTCTYNKLKKVPDVFNAKSNYIMSSVDFSHNEIGEFENSEEYQGINVNELNLSYNRLKRFPSELFKAGSPLSILMLSGNGMETIEKGDLKGSMASNLQTIDLSYNKLSSVPAEDFASTRLPYLYGVGLSFNRFSKFPLEVLYNRTLTVMEIRHQRDENGNRILREWPTGLYTASSLRAFYIGSNDLRKIDDTISPNISIFEIKDNPNISIDMSDVCPYIEAGYYTLIYDKTQDIRGCDSLLD